MSTTYVTINVLFSIYSNNKYRNSKTKNNLFYIGLKVVILSQRILKRGMHGFIPDFDSTLNGKTPEREKQFIPFPIF